MTKDTTIICDGCGNQYRPYDRFWILKRKVSVELSSENPFAPANEWDFCSQRCLKAWLSRAENKE